MRGVLGLIYSVLMVIGASSLMAQQSYIVLEKHSKKVLLASGSEYKRPVGGMVQMATAKVALDWRKVSNVSSTSMIPVPAAAVMQGGSNPLKLAAGDRLKLRDLLYACILSDDAVASRTLAYHVGSDLLRRRGQAGDPLGAFVFEMNQLAKALGMSRTKFVSPDDRMLGKSSNMASASDMARLSIKLVDDTGYRFYAKQKSRTVTVHKASGVNQSYIVTNANVMLGGAQKIIGLRMSYGGGQHAAIVSDRLPYRIKSASGTEEVTPVQLISVVLGSPSSMGSSKQLISQGWSAYERWRQAGYLAYPDRRGFIKVPR
ncbi:serine hydrolase [Rubritalea marina]|uniref:serine hydrolase n=1 Tax=Rubritalea marina TaxID=361055 RepID=UPI001969C983|nr:serine hydrolase [Rubritalea marina]